MDQPTFSHKWGVIVNPVAGKRRLRKEWINIYRSLKRASLHLSVQSTEYAGHAIEIAQKLVETGFRKILIVGGDGTVNEVVNGIYRANIPDKDKVTLALVPYGTGNDWSRYCGLNKLTNKSITEVLQRQQTEKIDICTIDYTCNGEQRTQYFINGAGYGIDAAVVNKTNYLKKIFGGHAWVYYISAIIAVFQYQSKNIDIVSKEKHINDRIFTLSIGNSRYSGGGLVMTQGDPTDNLFYVTAVRQPSFFQIPSGLSHLFRGKLFEFPLAETIETNQFDVTLPADMIVETDGVVLQGDGSYHFSIIHHGINMIVNRQ